MSGMMPVLFHLSGAATGSLIAAIWQGGVLAALVLLVLRLFPNLSAAARAVVWLNVFLLLTLLHGLPLLFAGSPVSRGAELHVDPRWSLIVTAAWLALSLFRAGQLLLGAAHVRGLARRAVPVHTDAEVQQLLHGVRGRAAIELCASDEVARPSVLGFLHPRILMPPALLADLNTRELRQVVMHELEHLRRGDDWTNLLQKLALVLFPLNPALLWVERRVCAERELACDDRVIDSGMGRKAYALCLTHLAEYALVRRGFSLVLGAWEHRPELVRRVQRILSQPARSMGRRSALAASGTVIAGALGCTLTLAHAPQLVSFSPAPQLQQARMMDAPEFRELSRELGGTPQLARAVMPSSPQHEAKPVKTTFHPRRKAHVPPPAARLASLRTPVPPAAENFVVMAQWTETSANAQMVVAEWSEIHAAPHVSTPGTRHMQPSGPQLRMQPAYAIVPTPQGWLILQI